MVQGQAAPNTPMSMSSTFFSLQQSQIQRKMCLTTLEELQPAPLTLQMLMIALAHRHRLNPHAGIPLVSVLTLASLSPQCFILLEIQFSEEIKKLLLISVG